MARNLVFFLLLLSGFVSTASAQNRSISGTVTGEDGKPIAGAAIAVEGSSAGTTTDPNGHFAFTLPPRENTVLVVSFIGYESQRIPVGTRTTFDITLREDVQSIQDVVVTGYGTQRKAAFTGAASIVGDEVVNKKSDANFLKSLEGAIPGVQMNNSSSMPGTWGSVYVRGRGSLSSGTAPLYVIDGMPVNSDYSTLDENSNTFFDPMASINASDIESVTVLKDAAATAIYGSRAANGVIVITTKKGEQGQFNLNLDIKQGFVSMGNHNMEYANAQETHDLFAQGYENYYGDASNYGFSSWGDYITQLYNWDGKSSYDWVDKVTRKGYYQDYNINLSGRTGKTGYYASLGYLGTEGLVIGSDLERFSGRLNLDSSWKCFSFGVNSSYSYSIQNGFSQSVAGSMSSPLTGAVSSMTPMDPFYDEDGNYANINYYNPLALQDSELGDMNRVWNQTVNINPYLRVDFGRGIYAKSTLGINIADQREYQYWSAVYNPQGMDYNGLGQQYNTKNTVITWNNVLGWQHLFDEKHDVSLMLGQEMQRKYLTQEYYAGYNFPYADIGMRDLSTAGTWMDSSYYTAEATLASYFLDAHYAYDDRYYLSASFRRDGSSVFGSDNRWGNFWSVGAKWRLTGENFLRDNPILTNAALRVSYGTVGNQDIGWYASRAFYTAGYNYNGVPGTIPSGYDNPDLTWETSRKFDIGFDIGLIDRINLTFDYYNETTTDALYDVPVSMTSGVSSIMQNIGSIRNRGVELAVNATVMHKRDFVWNAYANFTWNENRVLELGLDDPIESSLSIIEEGRPFRQFYMKEWAGVDYETGKPLWYLNETGDETTSDYNAAAKRYLGSADPKFIGGFGTSLKWKGLDFNVDFTYRLGGKVYDLGAAYTGFGMSTYTPLKEVALDSWTPENKDAKYPQWILNDPYNATADSSRFLYDGSFLRIGNITLGYTLPENWTRKVLIQRLRIYVSIDNAYTFASSDFVGYNPETYSSGYIAWQYPATRTFIGGVQLTF